MNPEQLAEAVKKARDVMENARKKLILGTGKANNGAEMTYAAAAKALADIDPTFVLPKKKYRCG